MNLLSGDSDPSRPQPTLRERKCARTKHALLRAAVERLRDKHLDEITVKELCENVQVCEATFFNYFPKKTDLLHYFVQIWTLEVLWHARAKAGPDSGLRFIEEVFAYTGRQLANHPRVMLEIIAHMASDPMAPGACQARPELSLAERMEALPDCEGAECYPDLRVPDLFLPALERAMQRGELPTGTDREATMLSLLSVLFGVPLVLGPDRAAEIAGIYRFQLRTVWAGLRSDETAQAAE